jgi:hypothetical protein
MNELKEMFPDSVVKCESSKEVAQKSVRVIYTSTSPFRQTANCILRLECRI